MKVLIINTSERTGGAAVAASRLCEALVNNGIKARMLVMRKQTSTLYVAETGGGLIGGWHFLWERLVIWTTNLFSYANLFKVSIANTGTDITRTQEFREADVIHLHWTCQGFLSLHGLEKVLKSGKPVVWTLHDMWALTGICHHAYECHRYEGECGECPFLRHPSADDLSHRVHLRKQRLLQGQRLHLVAVSQWLAEKAQASTLTRQLPISVIANSISLSDFRIEDRTDARTMLDVPNTARGVIAFGAARIDDSIKGFGYLCEALQQLVVSGRYQAKALHVLLFGGIKDMTVLLKLPVPYTYLGYVSDEDQLSLVYSASNVLVSSSLYETFGQTLVEAQACGCLPVSFDGSGQTDIIDHMKTGYLARRLSAESLAEGIDWGICANISRQDLRRNVKRRYAESVIAQKYVTLYQQLSHLSTS